MKKDKEWLKKELKEEERSLKYIYDNYVPYEKVLIADDVEDLINQLEEPETLSYEWIDKMRHKVNNQDFEYVYEGALRNLLLPQQDLDSAHDLLLENTTLSKEDFDLYWNCINDGVTVSELKQQEKVIVPQFVADWIEKNKEYLTIYGALDEAGNDTGDLFDWVQRDDMETLSRAWLDGYEVEKEAQWVVYQQDVNKLYLQRFSIWQENNNNYSFEYDKETAIKFTDKQKAKAVALLINGQVEEI